MALLSWDRLRAGLAVPWRGEGRGESVPVRDEAGWFSCWVCVLVACWAGLMPGVVWGQLNPITVQVSPEDVGVGGVVRPGDWTPMLVAVDNQSSRTRQVSCEWTLKDADGDEMIASRQAALTARRLNRLWLYAPIPITVDASKPLAGWKVRVRDAESGRLLAVTDAASTKPVAPETAVIGLTGNAGPGLERYREQDTQHETILFKRGLDPAGLPHHWYGLSTLQALVWTSDSTGPADPAINLPTLEAIRNWVRRGGHLIIALPTVGSTWGDSPLADLLPPVTAQRREDVTIPSWAMPLLAETASTRIGLKVLEPQPGREQAVDILLRDKAGRPVVVAHSVGFGRVTLLGIDLADPRFRQPLISPPALWKPIFGWTSPAYPRQRLDRMRDRNEIAGMHLRQMMVLGGFVPALIAMTETATTALIIAIALFGVYWLAAGPVLFGLLKQQGLERHSWALFTAVVLGFSLVTWSAAAVLRPTSTKVAHFSVVDVDTASGLLRTRSWANLFVPKHTKAEVSLGADPDQTSTIAASGALPLAEQVGFVNPQRYRVHATEPAEVAFPMRSTSRQFNVHYLAETSAVMEATGTNWGPSLAEVVEVGRQERSNRVDPGRLTGQLVHDLPGPLHYVKLFWCRGDGNVSVWSEQPLPDLWPAGQPIELGLLPPRPRPLAVTPQGENLGTQQGQGFLGKRMQTATNRFQPGNLPAPDVSPQDNEIFSSVELLSFYSLMPPPLFKRTVLTQTPPKHYTRNLGRHLDLSHFAPLRRLIVIGYLKDTAAIPLPLNVDGEPVPRVDKRSWTVVRWILPIRDGSGGK